MQNKEEQVGISIQAAYTVAQEQAIEIEGILGDLEAEFQAKSTAEQAVRNLQSAVSSLGRTINNQQASIDYKRSICTVLAADNRSLKKDIAHRSANSRLLLGQNQRSAAEIRRLVGEVRELQSRGTEMANIMVASTMAWKQVVADMERNQDAPKQEHGAVLLGIGSEAAKEQRHNFSFNSTNLSPTHEFDEEHGTKLLETYNNPLVADGMRRLTKRTSVQLQRQSPLVLLDSAPGTPKESGFETVPIGAEHEAMTLPQQALDTTSSHIVHKRRKPRDTPPFRMSDMELDYGSKLFKKQRQL